jgi:hypothetical protein
VNRKFQLIGNFVILLGFFWLLASTPSYADATDILINEIMVNPSSGNPEWIELFNNSSEASVDLDGMWIMITRGKDTHTYEARIELSGSLPRNGFLTFPSTFPASQDELTPNPGSDVGDEFIPDNGACLSVFTDSTTSVFTMKYGTVECDSGITPTDATGVSIVEDESLNAQLTWNPSSVPPSATWTSDSSPTKGWCDADVDSSCPSISSTIVPLIQAEGVTTNLDSMADMSRISNLYFEKTNRGKIEFANEVNFTDQDTMNWLQEIDQKMSISQGIISLDADLIVNLINTQANLTMYNISLVNPTIQVTNTDGSAGDSSIVSNLSYDSDTEALTFSAAHFTTFTAVESSDSSSSTTNASPPSCGDWPPTNAPNLFQIDMTTDSATLYFSPVNDYLNYYYIAYGHDKKPQFGLQYPSTLSTGVETKIIQALLPNTTYYFQVRGGNGCAPGPWSNWMKAKTDSIAQAEISPPNIAKPTTNEPTPTNEPEITQSSESTDEITSKTENLSSPVPSPEPETKQSENFFQKVINFFTNLF